VVVPNVVGLARAVAERAMREARLTAEFSDDAASTGTPDSVVTQSPAAGTALRVGAAVRVAVATGVVVPAMVGQVRDRAVALAAAAGLVVSIQSAADQAGTAGVVSSQEPQANTRVARGTAITLFLPLPAATLIAVPNVVGLARVQAEAALTGLGLGARVTEADNAAPANTVVSQSPDPNVQVALGSQIALVVARQAQTPTPVIPTPSAPTPPVIPVWLTPLLVVVALVGWQAWKFVRADPGPTGQPTEIHAATPQIDLEPQAGASSLRLEVFGKSLVDLEVRVRATHDPGEQSVRVDGETLIADERRVYE
jgi:beta-lactam-binding protein with PASTA domain